MPDRTIKSSGQNDMIALVDSLMTYIVFVELALIVIIGIFPTYLVFLTIVTLLNKPGPVKRAGILRRFAFVIPAYNEERTIQKTIESLQKVDYPADMFGIIVVADNCSDRTADVARSRGAIVYERTDETFRGKGHALRWMFDKLISEGLAYDAVVVVDADSTVSPNFLQVMDAKLQSGSLAIQANDLVEPKPQQSWSASMTSIGFLLYNYVRPQARSVLGGSTGLRGNGMCFRLDLFRTIPWNAYSKTEDLEYGLRLVLHDIAVSFAPQAVVLAVMPQNPQNAETQRSRWEGGRFPIIRQFAKPLFLGWLRKGSFMHLDALIDLMTPPLVNLLGVVTFAFIVRAGLMFFESTSNAGLTVAWGILVAMMLAHVGIGLLAAGADAALIRELRYVPRYFIWKIRLYLKTALRKGSGEWIRTTRESSSTS